MTLAIICVRCGKRRHLARRFDEGWVCHTCLPLERATKKPSPTKLTRRPIPAAEWSIP